MENPRHLKDLIQRIDQVGARLVAPTQRIESLFLGTGAELMGCAELLQKVISQFEALPELFNSESLNSSSKQLAQVGERAMWIADEMRNAGKDLDRLKSALGEAELPVDSLRRTVKMMGMVAANARVGSESLTEATSGFGAFADDVSDLSASMTSTVNEFFNTFEHLTLAVGDVAIAQARFVAGQLEPLAENATSLAKSLDDLATQRAGMVARTTETSRMTRDVYMRLGETVMAMQSGDAVRQRLEHISLALQKIGQHDLNSNAISHLLELQGRQLTGAGEMLAAEMDSAESNIVQLGQYVQQLLEHSKSLHGGGNKSVLGKLRRVVKETIVVLQHCETERQRLDAVAGDVQRTVKQMLRNVESVEQLEQRMRIVSLNAAVRCSKLDQRGRALNVVAQQLRELTRETLAVAGSAVTVLRKAASISEEFSASLTGNSVENMANLEDAAKEALDILSTFDARFVQALAGLSVDVPAVKQKLNEVRIRLLENGHLASEVLSVEDRLVDTGIEPNWNGFSEDVLDDFRQIYTMEAERQIHDDFVANAGTSEAA